MSIFFKKDADANDDNFDYHDDDYDEDGNDDDDSNDDDVVVVDKDKDLSPVFLVEH